MKITLRFFLIAVIALIFGACTKSAEDVPLTSEQQAIVSLTGVGNKVWKLKKVFTNSVQNVLTVDQMKYTKTYTITPGQAQSGTFVNSDGIKGKWSLNGPKNLIEVISNNQAGPVQISYLINELSDAVLDIEYTANFITIREVYNAF